MLCCVLCMKHAAAGSTQQKLERKMNDACCLDFFWFFRPDICGSHSATSIALEGGYSRGRGSLCYGAGARVVVYITAKSKKKSVSVGCGVRAKTENRAELEPPPFLKAGRYATITLLYKNQIENRARVVCGCVYNCKKQKAKRKDTGTHRQATKNPNQIKSNQINLITTPQRWGVFVCGFQR